MTKVKYALCQLSNESKGCHHLFNPKTNQLIISSGVVFYEKSYWNWNESEQVPIMMDPVHSSSIMEELVTPPSSLIENPTCSLSSEESSSSSFKLVLLPER